MDAVYRRRRIAAGAVLAGVVVLGVLVLRGCGDEQAQSGGGPVEQVERRPELPGGGRTILPGHRVVAYYGAPQDRQLGTLGIGTPAEAGRRLLRTAARYERLDGPTLPAMELIAVIAAAHPGGDGQYRTRQPDGVIRRYLRAARRIGALLILDVQPGRADFLQEARPLRRWLEQPDVSLALDPEWRVGPHEVPGQVIGSVSAQEVNAVSYWLDEIVREGDLPQKLLLLHRFTPGMISDERRLKQRDGLAIAVNIDGFGGRAVKRAKYHELASGRDALFDGFKLFFEEDTDLLTPRQVLRLRPPPDVVVYE